MGSFFFFFLYFSVFRLCILVERSCKTRGNNATIRVHEDAIMNRKHAAYKTRDPFGLADVAYLFKGLTLELKFVGGISELSCDNCQYKDLVLSE